VRLDKDGSIVSWSSKEPKRPGVKMLRKVCTLHAGSVPSQCVSLFFWWPGDFSKFCVLLQFITTHGIHTQKVTCKF